MTQNILGDQKYIILNIVYIFLPLKDKAFTIAPLKDKIIPNTQQTKSVILMCKIKELKRELGTAVLL